MATLRENTSSSSFPLSNCLNEVSKPSLEKCQSQMKLKTKSASFAGASAAVLSFTLPSSSKKTGNDEELSWIEDIVQLASGSEQKKCKKQEFLCHDYEQDFEDDAEEPLSSKDGVPSTVFVAGQVESGNLDCSNRYLKELLLDDMGTLQEALEGRHLDDLGFEDDDEDLLSEGDIEDEDEVDDFDAHYESEKPLVGALKKEQHLYQEEPTIFVCCRSTPTRSTSSKNKYQKELLMDDMCGLREKLASTRNYYGQFDVDEDNEDLLSEGDLESVYENDDEDDDAATIETSTELSDLDFLMAPQALARGTRSDSSCRSFSQNE
mmetsp:Transcript_5440/g.10227  ORF Transcript_5440/g.10227 Transcript_5440/m.10227 type:complete len:321 (+) Transcript_5440:86-1048(+)